MIDWSKPIRLRMTPTYLATVTYSYQNNRLIGWTTGDGEYLNAFVDSEGTCTGLLHMHVNHVPDRELKNFVENVPEDNRNQMGPMLAPRLRLYVHVKMPPILQYWAGNKWHDVPVVQGSEC